ncbi:MAG TPA: hypothetical protein PL009_01350 [Flavipsychrobacter sp.]|nr:hypothetical protein [Flavipsychrobacter sp.]
MVAIFDGMNKVMRFIFFGNVFYGVCAVALSVEAGLQLLGDVNDWLYYVLTFLAAVLYYNVAYITEKPSLSLHPRSRWYAQHLKSIKAAHFWLTVVFIAGLLFLLWKYWEGILVMPFYLWLVVLVFPVVASFYYGINHRAVKRYNLRDIGWLKPFIIGFSWAGLVTVFPVVYYCITHDVVFPLSVFGVLLFVKNCMFISLLCILFDIKDYATDYNQRLKTFVVNFGLRKTIFYIIIPLTIVGLGSFLTYGFTQGFSREKILLNTVPFVLLLLVARSLQRRKSIFYYLVIIDGLMLVKALCGSIAALYF